MKKFEPKHNVQIYPTRQRIVPNDRLSKVLFNLTDEDYLLALERQEPIDLVEMKNHKKLGEILSPFKISLDGDNEFFCLTEPLNQLTAPFFPSLSPNTLSATLSSRRKSFIAI